MTSAARTTEPLRSGLPQKGFTLIEIVVVLAIAAVIMAGAVGLMVFSSDERTLRNASSQIELMAKQARTTAILHQTPYALEFREGVVRIMPFAQTGLDEKRLRDLEEGEQGNNSQRFFLEDGMTLFVRRWNSQEWFATGKGQIHVWRFDPDGLCEPLSIRLNVGNSFSLDTFHPLTATVTYSEMEAR